MTNIDEKALAHTLSFIKQPENARLIRHAITSYEDAKESEQSGSSGLCNATKLLFEEKHSRCDCGIADATFEALEAVCKN